MQVIKTESYYDETSMPRNRALVCLECNKYVMSSFNVEMAAYNCPECNGSLNESTRLRTKNTFIIDFLTSCLLSIIFLFMVYYAVTCIIEANKRN